MKRYDSYKDSGIYFLPKLPSNWEIRKGKYLFNEENRPVRSDDEIVTCFRDGQVTLRKNRRTEGFTNSLKEIGYQGVRKGDLVIHNMDAFAGAIGISDSDGKATPVYACCTPKSEEVSQYYYCYLLRYLARNGFILSLAKGIRERSTDFRFNDFKELYLPVPTRKEQDAIVAYLDSATSKIDEAIAQQQKMIDLLNERKQIIINNAVTKGLDPNVKMKPSGIDWIGDIPEHWEVKKIKTMMSLQRGHDLTSENFVNGSIPVYGSGGLMGYHKIMTSKAPSIIIGRSGSVGKLQYIKEDFWAHNTTIFMTENRGNNTKYLYYMLCSIDLKALATQTAVPTLDRKNVLAYIYPLTNNLVEQDKIVKYLDEKIKMLNESITNCNKQISLLQERKQIIINDVVTGKVKVV